MYRQLPALLAASVMVTACAGLPKTFKDPDVQLHEVALRGVGLTGGSMDLVVDIYNPNHFSVRGLRMDLGFDVDSTHVGDIAYRDEFRLNGGDTTRLVLPLRFTWTGASAALRSALGYGDIPYTMRGQVTVHTAAGDQVIPFTRQGRAPLTRPTALAPSAAGDVSAN